MQHPKKIFQPPAKNVAASPSTSHLVQKDHQGGLKVLVGQRPLWHHKVSQTLYHSQKVLLRWPLLSFQSLFPGSVVTGVGGSSIVSGYFCHVPLFMSSNNVIEAVLLHFFHTNKSWDIELFISFHIFGCWCADSMSPSGVGLGQQPRVKSRCRSVWAFFYL